MAARAIPRLLARARLAVAIKQGRDGRAAPSAVRRFPVRRRTAPIPLANEGTAPAGTSPRDCPYRSAVDAAESSPRCNRGLIVRERFKPRTGRQKSCGKPSFARSGAGFIRQPEPTADAVGYYRPLLRSLPASFRSKWHI